MKAQRGRVSRNRGHWYGRLDTSRQFTSEATGLRPTLYPRVGMKGRQGSQITVRWVNLATNSWNSLGTTSQRKWITWSASDIRLVDRDCGCRRSTQLKAELTQYTKLGNALPRKEESFMSFDDRFVAWDRYSENRRVV